MIVDQGTFETDAPEENMLDTRTSKVAILASSGAFGAIEFGCSWSDARPVRMVALLNVNIVEYGLNTISVLVKDDTPATDSFYLPVYPVPIGDFQSHLFFELPDSVLVDMDRITEIMIFMNDSDVVFGSKDPYTGDVTAAQFQCGGIWAGPIWQPTNGIKFAAIQQGITENARGVYSIGGQFYPHPQPRQRISSFEFGGLLEDEIYSTDVDYPSLQQLASWCARSRPLIALPQNDDAELIYTMGCYGYLTQDPTWVHQDGFLTGEYSDRKRMYAAGLQMREAL
jgi:hypothetical protein